MTEDRYEQSLATIYAVSVGLSGGHYEPKSERDRLLALELIELLEKHELARLKKEEDES